MEDKQKTCNLLVDIMVANSSGTLWLFKVVYLN